MATVSFDTKFQVKDSKSANKFAKSFANPSVVILPERDEKSDKEKGLALLKRALSASMKP